MPGVWAVIASGPSLTQQDVDLIKAARDDGRIAGVAAVSNVGLDMAPWADCLVSHDSAWWASHPEAHDFKGERVCANSQIRGGIAFRPPMFNGCNSGLMAMEYIRKTQKPKLILLLGFDMHGTHYFGAHTRPRLRNTNARRFAEHIAQFNEWRGGDVINCTPGSALKKFPLKPLPECLIDASAPQG
jgi:hypothetical protein